MSMGKYLKKLKYLYKKDNTAIKITPTKSM